MRLRLDTLVAVRKMDQRFDNSGNTVMDTRGNPPTG